MSDKGEAQLCVSIQCSCLQLTEIPVFNIKVTSLPVHMCHRSGHIQWCTVVYDVSRVGT